MTITEDGKRYAEKGDVLELTDVHGVGEHFPPERAKVIRVNARTVTVEFKNGDQYLVDGRQARIIVPKGPRS